MTIKVGDTLPDGKLPNPPNTMRPPDADNPRHQRRRGGQRQENRDLAVPGAYTPTCSAKHVPSYVKNHGQLKAKGVDEIWCVATNDAFVMAAWGRDQKAGGKVRMLGRRQREWTKKLGLSLDLTARNMGVRLAALLDAGRERRGEEVEHRSTRKYEVSGAEDDAGADLERPQRGTPAVDLVAGFG